MDTSNRSCIDCNSVATNCLQCYNSSYCNSCNVGYIYSSTNNSCIQQLCSSLLCIVCTNSGNYCMQCINGYENVSGICMPICGDFMK